MNFSTLELCVLQMGVMTILKEEVQKNCPHIQEDEMFQFFVSRSIGPAATFCMKNIGKGTSQKSPVELLFDLITNIAKEIDDRLTNEENLKKD